MAIIHTGGKRGRFYPPDEGNCFAWYDAADDSSIALNGSDVSQWNDKSGNGRHVVQGVSAAQPAYTDTVNGKNVITFDGVTEYLEGAITAYTGTTMTTYLMCKKIGAGTTSSVLALRDSAETDVADTVGQSYNVYEQVALYSRTYRGAARSQIAAPVIVAGEQYLARAYHNGTNMQIFRTNSTSNYAGDIIASVAAFDFNRILLGSRYSAGAYTPSYVGYICEIIMYSSAIGKDSATDRRITDYLLSKWGI